MELWKVEFKITQNIKRKIFLMDVWKARFECPLMRKQSLYGFVEGRIAGIIKIFRSVEVWMENY